MPPNTFGSNSFSSEDRVKPIKLGSGGANPFESYKSKANDLKSVEGLYDLAGKSGLSDQADKMVRRSGGESQKFFSGGFVMDAMDILNIGSYGMVGMVKGKTFADGVKNRESLSDDDALGKYGWQGKVAGFLGDILLDPLTYIAPVKLVGKIPGVMKGVTFATEKVFGKLKTIEVRAKIMNEGTNVNPRKIVRKGLTDNSDYVYQGVGKGKESDFLTTSIGEANSYANQKGLKGTGEIRVYKYSDLPDELVTITIDDAYYENVIEKFGKDYVDRRLNKQEYSKFRSAIGFRKEEIAKLNKVGTIERDSTGINNDNLVDELNNFLPENKIASAKASADSKALSEIETIGIKGQKTFTRKGGWSPLTFLADKLIYGFAVDPKFLSGVQKIAGQHDSMLGDAEDLIKVMSELKPGVFDRTVSKGVDGRMLSTNLKDLEISMKREGLDSEYESVAKMYGLRDSLMNQLEELGVLTKETKDAHWGTYLKQSYDEFLTAKKEFIGTKSGVITDSKKRIEGLTPEMMEDMGQVQDVGILWGTTLLKQIDLLKKAKIQKYTADGYAMTTDMLSEYGEKGGKMSDLHQVTNDPLKYGALSGKYVSKEVWNALKGSFEPTKEMGENIVLGFKHIKVVWNPASHVRNAFSASIQNWWKMGMGPWRIDKYYDAVREFKNGGKDLEDMKSLGFSERSGYLNELMSNYLTNTELIGKSITGQIGGTKSSTVKYLKKLDKIMMNSYGHTDNIAKLAGYKYGLSKGLSKEDAYAQAMAATFNYSEITPFVHQMRRAIWGVPFITFALKATPLVAETLINNPNRISVFGKIRNDLFKAAGVEGEQESEALPDYMRDDMFVMRLPWKDDQGRSMYFDMSYIIPFGGIADGTFVRTPFALNPAVGMIRELSLNETFSGSKIFNESDDISTVLADISLHIGKLGLPPPVTDAMSDGYKKDGKRKPSKIGWEKFGGETQDLGPGERNYYQTAFRMIGMGATPFEINSKESALAYSQKYNLTKLLVENGVIKTFNNPYLPKDSEYRPENVGLEPASISDREVRPIGR